MVGSKAKLQSKEPLSGYPAESNSGEEDLGPESVFAKRAVFKLVDKESTEAEMEPEPLGAKAAASAAAFTVGTPAEERARREDACLNSSCES